MLKPKVVVQDVHSDDSTLPLNVSGDMRVVHIDSEEGAGSIAAEETTVGDATLAELEGDSDLESLSDHSEAGDGHKETDPMRRDMPVSTAYWKPEEVDALMTALNVNRKAIKFHFDGPGGGRDVKRRAWYDVAGMSISILCINKIIKQFLHKIFTFDQLG